MNALHKTLVSLAGTLALASVCRADIDSNANGASDIWERMFNGGELFTALDMNADPDGDGWSNAKEALAGTDPFNSAPPLGLLQTEITAHPTVAGTFTLRWTPVAGKQTTLYVSPDLESWTLFDTFPSSGGEEIELAMDVSHPDGSSPDKLFWRVMVSDTYSVGNGLSDYETQALGMAPGFTDTNSNLIPDDFETANSGLFSVFPPVLATKMPRLQTQTKPLFLWNDTGAAVNYTVTVNGADVPVYSHLDSLTGGVTYAWEEISTTGTRFASISNADDNSEVALFSGFSFPFFGQNYSQVFVNSNGLLSFAGATSDRNNRTLPNSSAPPSIIAVLWDDLDTRDDRTSGEVYFKQESDRFIIQYQDVTRYGGTDTLTFQVVLFADGRIQLRYKTVNGTTNSATVGVQNQTRDDGLEILYNAAYLVSGLAIEIVPVSEFLKLSPTSGSVPAHSSFSLDAVFDSFRLVPGAYYAQVDVSHDAPSPSPIRIPARLEVENVPGTVALTSPAEGFSILEGKSVNFSATATDPEGVARVEFYYDSMKFGEDLTSSYSLSSSNIPAGTHYITARMVDVFGQIVDSPQRTLSVIADTDRDGIPNYWELENQLDPNDASDATADPDLDGYTNFEEYTLGKNPKVAEDSDGDGIPDGIERKLIYRTPSGGWGFFNINNPDTDNNGTPDGAEDYDLDGLSTLQEILAGTDANKTDTDLDGVNDGKEIALGTNPLVPDAWFDALGVARDSDGDGLSDVFEIMIGTNPFNADTNGNSMNDGDELDAGGSPSAPGSAPSPIPPPVTGPEPPADAPTQTPAPLSPVGYEILVESKTVSFPKHGFESFQTLDPPRRYLKRDSSQSFRGGCPESGPLGVTGQRSTTVDELTGAETAVGDTFVNTGGDVQSAVRKAGSNNLSSYDDPPNSNSDCTGKVSYFTVLSDENTTPQMVTNGKTKLEAFEGGEALQSGTPFAYRNVHANELLFDYKKTQFKFKWDSEVAEEDRYALTYLVVFTPEDDPDTTEDESEEKEVVKTIEWDGQSAESTLYILDPDTEKPNMDGKYSLFPAEFIADWNRDGKIDSTDRGKVTNAKPWRWWINDDNDLTTAERGNSNQDIPKQITSNRDCNDLLVDGMRDLIDFFPLHLDLKSVLESFPESDYKYVLKHEDEALKFFEYPTCVVNGSEEGKEPNRHVKDVGTGRGFAAKELKLASTQGSELSANMLSNSKEGKGVVVIEGAKKTNKPLVLEIIKKSDSNSVIEIDFPVRISDVEDMYRHVNMRGVTGGIGGHATQTGEPSDYPDDLTNGKYVAYIHGYNVNGESARGSQSNIYKRLHQLGSKARYIGLSWYGDPPPPNIHFIVPVPPDYHRAVDQALHTGQMASSHLTFTQNSGLTILAHSLGNVVAGNAIANHGLEVDQYFIINGAVPLEAYDSSQTANSTGDADMKRNMTEDNWKPYYDHGTGEQQRLFAANWHKLFASDSTDSRNMLTWKNIFAKSELLSVAYNFYSPSDEVVENADETETFSDSDNFDSLLAGARHSWVMQELGKGAKYSYLANQAFHDLNGGWYFHFAPSAADAWDKGYFIEEPGIFGQNRKYTPAEAQSGITDAALRIKPFYQPFLYRDLYDSAQGSATAGITANRYKLLGTGIPAISYAIATNSCPKFDLENPGEERNFNMPSQFMSSGVNTSWPEHENSNDPMDWMHSDFKDVALHFIHPMYQKMIDLAELDKN